MPRQNAKAHEKAAAEANQVKNYPTGPRPGWREKQEKARGGQGPLVPPPNPKRPQD